MKKFLVLIFMSIVSSSSHADMSPTEMDLYCSGLLLRTAGLIKDNINRFSGDAKSQLSQVISHLDNSGTVLLDRATKVTGFTVSAKGISAIGVNYAEKEIGNNVMIAIQSGTDQHTAVLNCLKRSTIPTTTTNTITAATTDNDFRKENEKKILRVYDLIRKSVESINDAGEKLSEIERVNRVYSFLVNKKGDGFWFAAACQASYEFQLAYNKNIRSQGEKNLLWEDKLLSNKKLFYVSVLKQNFQLLGAPQYNASYDLAQKEVAVYFYDLKESGREILSLEKINDYLLQCNRLSAVFDHRELPPLTNEEKHASKDSKPAINLTHKNSASGKKDDRADIKQRAEESCTQFIKQSWEKSGTDDYGRKIQQSFVQIFPTGPYGPGKYGQNNFYAFNLALNKNGNIIEFAIDCIFDSDGKVLGTEYRK